MLALTPEQEALKQAALAATPGEWQRGPYGGIFPVAPEGPAIASASLNGTWCRDHKANEEFIAAANPTTILALIAQLEAQAAPPETMAAKLDRLQGGKARHIAGLCANAGQQVAFDRRWSLARDGFGLQRNDESGEYVSHDDAVAVLHAALARSVQAVPEGWKLVPIKITPAMIESGIVAHYGKRRVAEVGGAQGVSMTVNNTDWSGVQAMRNFWKGALAAAPIFPSGEAAK